MARRGSMGAGRKGEALSNMTGANDQLLNLDTKRCLDGLAFLYECAGTSSFFDELISFFRQLIPFEIGAIFEFQKGAQPKSLWTCEVGYDADTQVYNRGLYLLDPCFDAYENHDLTGIFHLSREETDDFITNEFYRRYWKHIGIDDEFAGIYAIDSKRCIHISIMLSDVDREQSNMILNLFSALERTFCTLFKLHINISGFSDLSELRKRQDFHLMANRILSNFGRDVLTKREHAVLMLFLRGHSAKSIGRELDISPGTVSIHRTNFYKKLGISRQSELFALVIDSLLGTRSGKP